jgi:HTH-type transcriptional regulator, sugar sensing transcriptional regulator
MDLSILEDLGLSNAEAKIYVALLELGPSKTGLIIKKTKLQSSTVYHILSSLLEKGLITYTHKGKTKIFQSENPETLNKFLDDKKRRFNELLPELKQKEEGGTKKQEAKVYTGMKGIIASYYDILDTMKKGEEYCFFQVPNESIKEKRYQTFFSNYHRKRSDKGIKVKGILSEPSRKEAKIIYEGTKHVQIRFAKEIFPTGLVIYKDKVITLDMDEQIAVTIQSKAIADSYRKFFETKWEKAKS